MGYYTYYSMEARNIKDQTEFDSLIVALKARELPLTTTMKIPLVFSIVIPLIFLTIPLILNLMMNISGMNMIRI